MCHKRDVYPAAKQVGYGTPLEALFIEKFRLMSYETLSDEYKAC